MTSPIKRLIERRVTVRLTTAVATVLLQVLLTLACLVALQHNRTLQRQATMYQSMAGPLVGREVPQIAGIDWRGARQVVDYTHDRRPTLVYTLSKDCPNSHANWTAMQSIQALSPARLRIVYLATLDQLAEDYLQEHGMDRDIVLSKLDQSSAMSYQTRGTPQAELVDNKGVVVWGKLGAFTAADLTALVAAIEKHEGPSLAITSGGVR